MHMHCLHLLMCGLLLRSNRCFTLTYSNDEDADIVTEAANARRAAIGGIESFFYLGDSVMLAASSAFQKSLYELLHVCNK